jgi:exonuclease VII large subunit
MNAFHADVQQHTKRRMECMQEGLDFFVKYNRTTNSPQTQLQCYQQKIMELRAMLVRSESRNVEMETKHVKELAQVEKEKAELRIKFAEEMLEKERETSSLKIQLMEFRMIPQINVVGEAMTTLTNATQQKPRKRTVFRNGRTIEITNVYLLADGKTPNTCPFDGCRNYESVAAAVKSVKAFQIHLNLHHRVRDLL